MEMRRLLWTVFLGVLCRAEAGMMGDQCDWTGSGLTSTTERGVTPVYLRCREGSISWVYPRGALRLLFRPSLPADERDFKVCVRVIRRPDPPDLFHTLRLNDTEVAERFPARLFVEGARRLVPLYAPNDGDPRELRCFRSRRGRAALYVEAEPEDGPQKRKATFKYEARPLVRRHYDPATADCRPCTESELELAFCTSDLVSRGVIMMSEAREDLDTTQLTLRLTKLIRATSGDSSEPKEKSDDLAEDDDYYRYDVDNTLERTTHRNHKRRKTRSLHAHVHVSSVCGASAGAVSRGVIMMSEAREDLDTTQLTLRLTKLIRATSGDSSEPKEKSDDLAEDDDYYRYDVDNTLERTTHRNHKRRKTRSLHAHVHVSSVCGASAGAGEFLVMARRRLGRYSLVCAPRIDDWTELVKRRNADGTAHCLLQH